VCVDKIFEKQNFLKNLSLPKKMSQKKFLAEKNIRDFFTNFKNKKNLNF
jgi:hypothetical protein